jgi:Phosphodiester glycosidase
MVRRRRMLFSPESIAARRRNEHARARALARKLQRHPLLVAAALALAQTAAADWRGVSDTSEPSVAPGIEHRHIVLQDSAQGNATIDLAAFSSKNASLQLIDNPGASENLGETMKRGNLAAGVNGGYFDTEFKPLGLRVVDGTIRSPLIRARLLTGIVCASSRGIEIIRVGQFSAKKKCDTAIECGPFLIDAGTPVRGLDQARRARRTFVAVARGGGATLGASSELSLAELASAVAALPDFKTWRALNLDGGSSSAFWFRRKDGSVFSIAEDKPVRDFIGIVPR